MEPRYAPQCGAFFVALTTDFQITGNKKASSMSWLFVYGGGGRIRTIEGGAGRFTVCSLWPLGNPSRGFLYLESVFPTQLSKCFLMRTSQEIIWWRGTDSNHRRRSRQIYSLLPLATREPLQGIFILRKCFPNTAFQVLSYENITRNNMVEGDGFEPSKAEPADLQSAPFGHSGTPPRGFYT